MTERKGKLVRVSEASIELWGVDCSMQTHLTTFHFHLFRAVIQGHCIPISQATTSRLSTRSQAFFSN